MRHNYTQESRHLEYEYLDGNTYNDNNQYSFAMPYIIQQGQFYHISISVHHIDQVHQGKAWMTIRIET